MSPLSVGKVAGLGLVVILALSAGFFIWARLFAGGPVRFIPGGRLSGDVITEPIGDWDFAGSQQYLQVESTAEFLPYSSSTWFMVQGGELFVLLPRLFGTGLEDRIEIDPAVRIRIDGKIYPGSLAPVSDGAQLASLLGPLIRRTMSVEVSGIATPVTGSTGPTHGGIGVYRFESGE